MIFVFLSLFIVTFFYGCKKDIVSSIFDVRFEVNSVSESGGFKSSTVTCVNLTANYVKYKLGADDFKTIPVFYVNGIPWTSSIKLNSGTYELTEFLVYNDNKTPLDLTDDILVSATPHVGSEYASFCVNGTLSKSFEVNTDLKNEVKIDVVCFIPENYSNFGFAYQDKLPIFAQGTKWNKINWLFNHLDWYTGYQWNDIQGFIWLYDSNPWNGLPYAGMPAVTDLSQQMKIDADTYGANFSPLPGGWAAIIFVPAGTAHNATSATIQTMIVKIDP